jgi:uncharacterized membrane protein YdjX (TVP38/TMEM64 family)
MRSLMRPLLLVSVVLLIPIVPFLIWGEQLESWFNAWSQRQASQLTVAAVVAGLLATDIVLPIPSSMVSTFGGAQLGTWGGTLASWVGMTASAVAGFALARSCGPAVTRWLSRPEDVQRVEWASERFGPMFLVLARGVPVFAEASVLLLGIHRLSWRKFLPAMAASNLGIALAYSAFGTFAAHHQWLPLALGVSVALPLLWTTLARRWLVNRDMEDTKNNSGGDAP